MSTETKASSADIVKRHKERLFPNISNYYKNPIALDHAKGMHVWDVEGNEYIAVMRGFGASLFGHRPAFVVEAIQRQLELGFEIGPIQPLVGEAAALVREMTGMERVAFCNTGSE